MTGRNGSQRKGLFAGFLTGSAVCICLGAAASYVRPLDRLPVVPLEPEVATTEIVPNAPKDVTTEATIVTPKSDNTRVPNEAPAKEAPEADRDDANIAASIREVTDPVQTETPRIEAPVAVDVVDAQTGEAADTKPQVPATAPLTTLEAAPEQTFAEIDVSPGDATVDSPGAEETDLQEPLVEDAPITLALNTPKVETSDTDDAPSLPEVAAAPEATPEVGLSDGPEVDEATTQPDLPVAPTDEPVIALSKPVETPTVQIAPSAALETPQIEADETDQSDEPVLKAPEVGNTTSNAPQTEPQSEAVTTAPRQVATPTLDAEPQAPTLNQAAVVPEPEVAGTEQDTAPVAQSDLGEEETEQKQVVDRRNPPPPTFEGRAFDAFAVKFVPPNNKPFLTIILEHVGEGSVNMYDLLNFAQPITFGVKSTDELAKWRENEFRRGSFEVVALVPDADGAGLSETMEDSAVASRLDTYLTAVPGAVAILDAVGSDLYRNPRKVSRVAEELSETGRGLLIHEKFGVNRALEAARSAEIPAASLVRVIDAQRDAGAIRRALDKAALDASKTGATIVFGRTYPETVAAILPWLLGNSARSVTLAPLTSTMKRMVE